MKKLFILVLVFLFMTSIYAFAAPTAPELERQQHRLEVRKIKAEQRAAQKKGPTAADKQWADFWAKEGERSGLANMGPGVGNVVKNLNPVPFFKTQREQYEARKAAAKK